MYQAVIQRTNVPKGNKPILYSILVLSTIVIFSTTPIAHGESLEVWTDKPEYDHNTVIFLHGFVSDPINNVDVKIEVINPIFDVIKTTQLQVDYDGNFHTSIKTSEQAWLLDGTYIIRATYSDMSEEVQVELFGGVGGPITVSINAPTYDKGDTIRVTGGVGVLLSATKIYLTILDPLGGEVFSDEFEVGAYKKFASELTAGDGEWIYDGIYTIRVLYGNEKRMAEATFGYEGIEGKTAPEIPNISVTTDKQDYFIGDNIIISGTVKYPNTYAEIPVTIRVFDPAGNTASISHVLPTVSETFSTQLSTIMPPWESPGIYEVKVSYRDDTASTTFLFSSGETTSTPISEPAKGGEVVIPIGTSVQGCEDANECYIPNMLSVRTGERVSWFNKDTAIHTITSGTPGDGPDGNFHSEDFMPGFKFSHTFDESGEYSYYCMYHPWQTGVVIVEGDDVVEEDTPISLDVSVTASQVVIPSWIKDVAGFWCTDEINDENFLSAIQYLIDNDVIIVSAESVGEGFAQKLPSWIKSNACWWSKDQISDESFASGLQFLIENGIIRV